MSRAPSLKVMRQAAVWLVRLDDQPSDADQRAFNEWLALAPEHGNAIERLQGSLAPLRGLPQAPARAALATLTHQTPGGRTLKALALAAVVLVPGALALQQFPPAYLMADIRTGTGEWHEQQLPDGTWLRLDARSAVDLNFDAQNRTLHLISGEILLDVAKDANRPFRVITDQGSVRALGTRFVVERLDTATRLAMIESSTEVKNAEQQRTVHAGQQVRFDHSGIYSQAAVNGAEIEQAWASHQLIVKDQPLSEVLDQLNRYHSGYLMFDRTELTKIKVTAVLPADDSARALRLLARSLPIKIATFTPWVTRVSLDSNPPK